MDRKVLAEQLVKFMKMRSYAPMTLPELAMSMGLERKEMNALRRVAAELLKSGSIAKVKGDRYGASEDLDLIGGTVEFRQSGWAVLRDASGAVLADINPEDTGVALNGDKILARVLHRNFGGNERRRQHSERRDGNALANNRERKYAKVIRILERANATVVGTLKRSYNFWHIVPDDPRFFYDVIVADPAKSGVVPLPKEDDKVLVRLNDWVQRHINPTGEIVENFGESHTPMAEYKAILAKYRLEETFPATVLAEAEKTTQTVSKKETEGRLDCRKYFTLTIDPEDARDFDDAISLHREGSQWVVGVHIADVSHYVRQNSATDKEARKRGNSTYLTGTVIPMLPVELSNGICSLVEDEDRLAKSVFLSFDATGDCKKVSFADSVIRSNKRLSYEQAYALLKSDDLAYARAVKPPENFETAFSGKPLSELSDKELVRLRGAVRRLWSIASTLRKKRMRKGALDLEVPEIKIFCDAQGYAARIEKLVSDESHQLVEEFMLAANEAVARELFAHHIPFISRVHDKPDEDKLLDLREELELFGIYCGDLTNRREIIKVLSEISKHPQSYILKTKFLRSLKRAVYRASADGHFGLGKTYYAHFTSPIRRYADLTVHRNLSCLMKSANMKFASKTSETLMSKHALEQIADHISRTEQNSAEAERESRKIKLVEFFGRSAGTKNVFEGIITQLSNHGFFVELTESMAFGFVHVHSLKDDIYRLNDTATELRGRRTNQQFKIGDKIKLRVESVDPFKRQIDFAPADDSEKSSQPPRRGKKRRR